MDDAVPFGHVALLADYVAAHLHRVCHATALPARTDQYTHFVHTHLFAVLRYGPELAGCTSHVVSLAGVAAVVAVGSYDHEGPGHSAEEAAALLNIVEDTRLQTFLFLNINVSPVDPTSPNALS